MTSTEPSPAGSRTIPSTTTSATSGSGCSGAKRPGRRGRLIRTYPETKIGEFIVYILNESPNDQELFDKFDPADGTFAFPPQPALQTYETEIFGKSQKINKYRSGHETKSRTEASLYSIAKAILIRDSKSRKDRATLDLLLRGRLDGPQRKEFIQARI